MNRKRPKWTLGELSVYLGEYRDDTEYAPDWIKRGLTETLQHMHDYEFIELMKDILIVRSKRPTK